MASEVSLASGLSAGYESSVSNSKPARQQGHFFSSGWQFLMEEAVPRLVKERYSARESWKNKPFNEDDARFFFRGIEELSDLFTEDRPRGMPEYFRHPRFRSAYLLYFLPLQAAKFLALFQQHPEAIEAAIDHGRKTGSIRIADLGAGPGTASLALILLLYPRARELPLIEFEWFDTNATILEDGKELMKRLADRLGVRVSVRCHTKPWLKAPAILDKPLSLTILGHILNEGTRGEQVLAPVIRELDEKTSGAGLLMVEPATRDSAQLLARLRDELTRGPGSFWGPCLHHGPCPLASGRDWCHFSVPAAIPGRWFKAFSKGLSAERTWIKYCYLWIASRDYRASRVAAGTGRVVSDPIRIPSSGKTIILICQPGEVKRQPVPGRDSRYRRGQIIKIK